MRNKKKILEWLLTVVFIGEKKNSSIIDLLFSVMISSLARAQQKISFIMKALTDIITFDNQTRDKHIAEIYIRTDRVKETIPPTLKKSGSKMSLHRVSDSRYFLHCIGYSEKTEKTSNEDAQQGR
jgi:hypothetical protein